MLNKNIQFAVPKVECIIKCSECLNHTFRLSSLVSYTVNEVNHIVLTFDNCTIFIDAVKDYIRVLEKNHSCAAYIQIPESKSQQLKTACDKLIINKLFCGSVPPVLDKDIKSVLNEMNLFF